jgi:hypothetical protein
MYNPDNTKKLIVVNIAQTLIDYCSIQPDIDESKIQTAELIAQNMDLKRLIGKENVDRCIDPINLLTPPPQSDIDLRELVIPVICNFTYSRLLRMFPGTFTDAGYIIEKDASDKGVTANVSNEYKAIAETFMEDVFAFLKAEDPQDKEVKKESLTPSIRTFGGREFRGSN